MPDSLRIIPSKKISGDIVVPGDKSISHRAVIFAAISEHVVRIENIALGEDVLRTMEAMREMGVEIKSPRLLTQPTPFSKGGDQIFCEGGAIIHGVGLRGLTAPKKPIDCGNSGTTMRLLCGLLCAQKFDSVLIGDASLLKRPMARVAEPLRLMGAEIQLSSVETAPIHIVGNRWLVGMHHELKIPSAQVKSAILIAGLYAAGKTVVHELIPTRDHTERMLRNPPGTIKIPGDISSAAFFIALAAITENADIMIRDIGVNPFRTGMIDILKLMGADIEITNTRFFNHEPVADIRVQYRQLHGIVIPEHLIASAIDEFPIIFVAAAIASGNTLLRHAKELRTKESDRITAMVKNFEKLAISTEEYEDGILIFGDQTFLGGRVNSFGDHRVAMALAVAGNIAKDSVIVDDCACINTSFPNFISLTQQVGMNIQ